MMKIETVVNDSSELSNKNIETETVDVIKNVNQTTDEVKKSSDNSEIRTKKRFSVSEEITYTSEEAEDLTKTYSETLPVIEDKQVLNGTVVRIMKRKLLLILILNLTV